MQKLELVDLLKSSGIVGCGGAGFPTYAKVDDRAKIIILNACECEPLLKLHRSLLSEKALEILSTLEILRNTMNAEKVIIATKAEYKKTVESVEEFIENFENISLKLLDSVYPAGDEVVTIYETTGIIVPEGSLPIESGVAVFNVETVYNIHLALSGKSVTEKLVTVVGEVNNPKTIRVPIGTRLADVVDMCGGEKIKDPVYLVGGVMMGNIKPRLSSVTKNTNAIILLDKSHTLIQKKLSNNSINLKRGASICCQCSMCTDLCPRNLLGHSIDPSRFMLMATCKSTQDLEPYVNTMFCSGCGLCELYSCPQDLSPRTLILEMKNSLRAMGVKPTPNKNGKVNNLREYKKVPIKRLLARLNLTKYDGEIAYESQTFEPSEVKIMLSQHIGSPSKAVVAVGDKVQKNQLIATSGKGLSVGQHASITGVVTLVTDKYIIIKVEK